MLIAALFTKNAGAPATGLALADIDLYLYSRAKATGVVATVLNGVHPTEEVGGGIYTRAYVDDPATYDYFAYAHYTGVTVLDSVYSLQGTPAFNCCLPGAGAIEFIYTLTDSVTGLPIAGADVWVTTDIAGVNIIASGTTDVFGNVTFWLDPGTYYLWRQRPGYTFANPDTEVVTP